MPLHRRTLLLAGASTVLAAAAHAQSGAITSDIDAGNLRQSKTTPLGLYLSPTAAHAAMQADPSILLVDVRDPIEITFVGHPAGLSRIVPLRLATHSVDPESGQYRMRDNPNVVAEFDALLAERGVGRDHPVFVTCRSGSRSASAARMLIDAGYSAVWNLTEGFEGDRAEDGTRRLNGWRNAGLPWGYRLEPGVAWHG